MLFLIEYDRPRGKLVSLRVYPDSEGESADASRLELELRLLERGENHEVVVLQARDEDTIRRTHRRYFEDLTSIASTPIQ